MRGGQLAPSLGGVRHFVAVVVVAQETERTVAEEHAALSATDDSHMLPTFGKADATSESAETSTYYNSIKFHVILIACRCYFSFLIPKIDW